MHLQLAVISGLVLGCVAGATPEAGSAHATRLVRPGIEVALSDSLSLFRGRHVGLVTNHTGIDRAGRSDVELLREAGVELVALFSPEHGFRGAAAPGAAIQSASDSATGLPIYSLYGRTVAPTDSMLRGIDLMVVDLQDVGARYYTYISTAIEVMRASARHGIPTVILDRPNPIGGAVQGGLLDTAYRSFVGMLPVPMRHGLSMGELARFANRQLGIEARLVVIPADGWVRGRYLDETGLPFVPPSPNLKSVESLIHYPGTCLFEGTNLSVARGTDAPFEQIGAPWLDAAVVLERLDARARAGVDFEPVSFTPERPGDGKFADTLLHGIRLRVTDRSRYDPTATAAFLLDAIHQSAPTHFRFLERHFDRLAGNDALRLAIMSHGDVGALVRQWAEDALAFRSTVGRDLIYGPLLLE